MLESNPQATPETTRLIERLVVVAMFAALVFGVLQVLRPLSTAILFGTILVLATWPLRSWLVEKGAPRGLACVILLLILISCIVVPAIIVGPRISDKLLDVADRLRSFLESPPAIPDWASQLPFVGERISKAWTHLNRTEVQAALAPYWPDLGRGAALAAGVFAEGFIQLIISLAVATMLWFRGEVVTSAIMDISTRLGGPFAGELLFAATGAVRGIAYSVIGTAGIQSIFLAIGLAIAGVPNAAVLGLLSLFVAICQIGILLIPIWGGAAWWLYANGEPAWCVFMIVWGVVASTGDNVVRPWLASFGATMPMTLVFIGVLGGFLAFGFLGLFIGPTLLAVAYALLQSWRQQNLRKIGS